MLHHFRTGARVVRIATELCLILICGTLVLLLAAVLRLEHGPVDAGFARRYIEQALSSNDYDVAVGKLTLAWPRLGGAVLLDLTDFQLRQHGRLAASVDHAQFGLSRVLLLAGKIAPVSITLTHPNLHLVRAAGNHFALSLDRPDAGDEPPADTESGQQAFASVIRTLATQRRLFDFGNPLAHLRRLTISDAGLTVDDRIAGQTWHLTHANLTFTHDRQGLAAAVQVRIPGGRHGEAVIDAAATFRRASNDYSVHARVSNADASLFSREAPWLAPLGAQDITFNGDADGMLDAGFAVQRLRLTLAAGPGTLTLPTLYTRPVPYAGLGLDASYDRALQIFDVTRLALRSGDVAAVMTGRFSLAGGLVRGRATLGIPQATQAGLAALWPDRVTGSGQAWLTQKLSDGSLKDVSAAVAVTADLNPNRPLALKLSDMTAEFDAQDMTVDYCAPLRPATAAAGHGHFADGALGIDVRGARIGDIVVRGGKVVVTGLPGRGAADVTLQLAGPIPAGMAYIASAPLHFDPARFGVRLDALRGQVSTDLHLHFPTGSGEVRRSDVQVGVDGILTHVVLPAALHGADLTADQVTLRASQDTVTLAGDATLAGSPLSFTWQAALHPVPGDVLSHLTATVKTGDALRTRLVPGVASTVTGVVPVRADYSDYGNGKAALTLAADAGAASFVIPALDYRKPAAMPATLTLKAAVQDGTVRDVQNLTIAAPNFSVTNGSAAFAPVQGKAQLRSLRLDHLRLNETDATIRLDTSGAAARQLTISGKFFDARPFIRHRDLQAPYSGPPLQGNITVAALRAGDGRTINTASVRFAMTGDGMIDSFTVHGVAGAGRLLARLGASSKGGRDVSVQAEDGGAALQALGLYPNAVGGTLSVTGHAPVAAPRAFSGHAELHDFNVAHAPVLASILTGLSISDLPGMLAGHGIHFSSLQSDFTWQATPRGNMITVEDGRSTGASLGLTFAGDIDTAANRIAIHGDVVPFSGINGILNTVPIIDEILTGGRHGGIFAATYSITGTPADPQVSVNPLAALAPGFLRPLLFGK